MTSARSAQGSWITSRGEGNPARIRLIEASVRSRCSRHSACAIDLGREGVGQRGRRAVADAGAAIQPLNACSRVGQRNRRSGYSAPSASKGKQNDADRACNKWQRQPQTGPGCHQK